MSGHGDILALVREQRELFGRLESLGRRQEALAADGDGEDLLELLRERAPVVDRLVEIDRMLPSTRDRWEEFRERLSLDERERLDALAAEVAYLAAEVARRDEVDTRRLVDRRDALAGELAGISKARSASAAYGPRGGGPRFQDQRA